MHNPAISVIVPIYNVEHWLAPCVDSLLAQDFTDYELILVDDGSPDRCPALCDAYAEKDERIRVIHKPNGGLSDARNSGIAVAKGTYIAFVDSDDLVAPDYLSCLYQAAQSSGADMAVCAIKDIDEAGQSPAEPKITLPAATGVFSGTELMHCFFGHDSIYYTVAWNKLYRAELWKALRYPKGMLHEDDAVAHRLYAACKTVACIDKPLYFYRLRQGSIMRAAANPNSLDSVSAHAAWCHFFAEEHKDKALLDSSLKATWLLYLSLCSRLKHNEPSWLLFSRWLTVQAQLKELLPFLLPCKALTLRQKISCLIWVNKKLVPPAKTHKKRVVLLLPPGLPVPPTKGGAVETLAQHIAAENEIHKQLELVMVSQYDAAAAACCAFKNTLFYYQKESSGSLLHSINYRLHKIFARPIHWSRWYQQSLTFLKLLNADFYICEGGDLYGWQQASRVLGREKFIIHLHGEFQGNEQVDKIYSQAFAISDYIRTKWQNGTDRPCTVVPNCVNTSLFTPIASQNSEGTAALRQRLGYSADDFVVLFCGRTCPEKGIHQLISAFRKIKDPAVKLLVIGSPFFAAKSTSDYFDKLKASADTLQSRVQFTGFVPNTDLPRAFLASRHHGLRYYNFAPLRPGQPTPGFRYSQVSLWLKFRWLRNFYRMCIDYAFRPCLSSRLTLGGRTFPKKP